MSTTQQHGTLAGALAAQELFESMFPEGHTPKIDLTRPPVNPATGKRSPSAAERATWKRAAA